MPIRDSYQTMLLIEDVNVNVYDECGKSNIKYNVPNGQKKFFNGKMKNICDIGPYDPSFTTLFLLQISLE